MAETKSLKYVSKKFNLSESFLQKLIKHNLIDHAKAKGGQLSIFVYDFPRLHLLSKDKQYQKDIFQRPKHFLYEYHPELTDYLEFHDALDRFAWLIKLRYADRVMLKSKKYRIDVLFQLFLKELNYDPLKAKHNLATPHLSRKKIRFHLLQGWYNEISAGYPFSQDFNISSSLDWIEDDTELILFPSWKIVKYYYSIYSYYTSLVFTEDSRLSTIEHRKPSLYFNRHQLSKYSKFLFKFPFNIYYKKGEKRKTFLNTAKREWQFLYSRCPRDQRTIYELEKDYFSDLVSIFKSDSNQRDKMTILDILYKFRIWSNYRGIETITILKQGGLLLFLERNLYTISFFVGGLVELMALAIFGEDDFRHIFSDFYYNYIQDNELLNTKWHKVPQITRYRIYRHLKIVGKNPKGFKPPSKDDLELVS